MASDQLVDAKLILQSQLEVERRGVDAMISELEQVEPDLAEYAIEHLCDLHRALLALRGKPKASQRLYTRLQTLLLVCIVALRRSHYELWKHQHGEDPP